MNALRPDHFFTANSNVQPTRDADAPRVLAALTFMRMLEAGTAVVGHANNMPRPAIETRPPRD